MKYSPFFLHFVAVLSQKNIKSKGQEMKKSSKRKNILLIIAALAILLSLISFTACQMLGGSREGSSEKDIETFTVVKGNISQTVTSSGYVDTSNTKNYSLQMSGNTLYILSKGDTFSKGDKLAEVDNEKILIAIEQAETSIVAAESAISLAKINYQAALDANHVAIQLAKANEEMGQASTDAAFTALEDANGLARVSAASALQSIDDANNILAAARDSSAPDTQIAQYEANVNTAQGSYSQSSATNRQATDAAESGHEQSLISQSVTYWSNLGNLEVAQSQISITALAIEQAEVELELAGINIDLARLDLDDNIIYAPFDGIVLDSFYSKGEYASPSMTAISVISDDFVIKSDINETDIAKLGVGSEVQFTLDAFSGESFIGKIKEISPISTSEDGIISFEIIVEPENIDNFKLLHGLSANLTIITSEAEDVLYVPIQSVYKEDGKEYVDVLISDEIDPGNISESIKKVEVTTGLHDYNNIEVASGLKEGDVIITSEIIY